MPTPLFNPRLRSLALLAILGATLPLTAVSSRAQSTDTTNKSLSVGSLRGILRPERDLSLPARASGIIEKYGAAEGSQVEAGTVLLQLDDAVEKAEVANAEAALDGADAQLDQAKHELDRTTILRTDSIGSKKDFEDAQLAYAIAMAHRKQAQANLDTAKAHLAERTIIAPFSGLLYKHTREVGEAVDRLEPIIRLMDASKLVVTIYAGAELLGKFKVGQKTHMSVDSGPARGATPEATVTYVDPIMDPATSTFRIKLELALTDKIQPGMSVTLQVPSETTKNAPGE